MSLNDLLAGGAKTIKLETVGETITGTIRNIATKQVTSFGSGQPEFWDDGNPKMQIVITIDAPELPEGEGSFYTKAWGTDKQALAAAVAETGLTADQALAPGNEITITHTELRPHKNPAFNATKIYSFQITPKAPASVNAALATPAPTSQAAPTTPNPPTPAPAPTPAPQAVQETPQATQQEPNIPALIQAGLTDQQIADATGTGPDVVAIIRANQPLQEGGNVNAAAPF